MRTFGATESHNDLYLDKGGSLAILLGAEAVAETSEHFAQTLRGEMIYETQSGIPYLGQTFERSPNLAQFEAALRRRLEAVPEVTSIEALDVQWVSGEIKYTATLETPQGLVSING